MIAAGEGESLVPALLEAVDTRHLARRNCCGHSPASAATTSRRSTTSSTPRTAAIARFVPKRAPARRRRCARPRSRRPTPLDPPATSIFTPDTEFGSRFLIEVVRGCANLCRFCWAGYNYLPVRAFPTDRILELARRRAAVSSRVGLVSIALCDHPDIEHILRSLKDMGYSISPASLRLDDLTPTIVSLLKESGERTLTIAPETGSDRLRRVINKTVTNDEILDRAELIFATGIENLKLYYMIGLPVRDGRGPRRDSRSDAAAARHHDAARARPRPHRPHRRQRQPADSQARHHLSVDADGAIRTSSSAR